MRSFGIALIAGGLAVQTALAGETGQSAAERPQFETTADLPELQAPSDVCGHLPPPLEPPIPVYPARAISLGIGGHCLINYYVDAQGQPFDIRAKCTDPVFEDSAAKAVSELRYLPEVAVDGCVQGTEFSYPLQYSLN